ncbi:Proteasome subunit beta [Quillaja saponaria]|uniref:Proteasome subunit beta n=1 Tax=Quillaja saponaria TaxID=32244 RepID=A0AAD7KT49_QUISA|nr:Proteasome subunit beta [Quillaja saponaria]
MKGEGQKGAAFMWDQDHRMLTDTVVLDSGYCYDMSIEEDAELARRAIYHATFRDGASGGVGSFYYVGPNEWKKLSVDAVGELHYKY